MAEVKRLQRSRTQRVLAGVCGGIGEYFGVDPVIVRVIWVLVSIPGPGILAYIVAWLIIPESPILPPREPVPAPPPGAP